MVFTKSPKTWRTISRELERLRAEHSGSPYRVSFPDLSIPNRGSTTSDTIPGGPTPPRRAPVRTVPLLIGAPHKQGLMVMSQEDREWSGGKKP